MHLAWLTDIHFDFLEPAGVQRFLGEVRACGADSVMLTGDISDAPNLINRLSEMDGAIERPIYFVLGNHDFYYGSIEGVRQSVVALCRERPRLQYLTSMSDPIALAPDLGLIGHDGWADARLGDYERSMVMMYDYRLIDELARMSKSDRWPVLRALGDAAAEAVREKLAIALARFPRVWLATHLPPLREACWHEGQVSNDEWAPHFTCKAMGDVILEMMRAHPERQLTVFCGHTHSPGIAEPLPNVTIHTGGARYGEPAIQRLLEV
jgi:Icc protein